MRYGCLVTPKAFCDDIAGRTGRQLRDPHDQRVITTRLLAAIASLAFDRILAIAR
jgi:hypothetical protein